MARLGLVPVAALLSLLAGGVSAGPLRNGVLGQRSYLVNETTTLETSSTSSSPSISISTISFGNISTTYAAYPTSSTSYAASSAASPAASSTFVICPDAACSQSTFSLPSEPSAPPPPPEEETTSAECIPRPTEGKLIEFLVVYTSTTTVAATFTAYVPPFPTLQLPTYCDGGGLNPPSTPPESHWSMPVVTKTKPAISLPKTVVEAPTEAPASTRTTLTFVTTDKNPSVYVPNDRAPDYSGTWDFAGDAPRGGHTKPPFTVTAGPDQVIINDSTFQGLMPGQTTTVTVDDGTFTIRPSDVVGEGASLTKPGPAPTDPPVLTTTAAGLSVGISGTQVVVDGTTLSIPPGGPATTIDGVVVSVGPSGVFVDGEALTQLHPRSEDGRVIVAGGDLLTASGQSVLVIHSTTWTYGPGIPATTETVDNDTIVIEPSGVGVRGATLGGPDVGPAAMSYEVIGGATLTQLGQSLLVINGTTFTVGPGATETTTTYGGEDMTVQSEGVTVGTLTLSYPFGVSVTTTITAAATDPGLPLETGSVAALGGSDEDDEDDAGVALRPSLLTGTAGLCMAIGVLLL